ncbi:MAG: permease [Actinomycetota bacterium]
MCECGSVPVARRLVLKGLSPVAPVTFMLAAPVLNPIVLVTTAIAFRGRGLLWPMVGGRAVLSFAVAVAVGWVLGARGRDELLRARAEDRCADGTCGHDHGSEVSGPEPRWSSFFGHLTGDFTMMAKYLVIGAAAAATLQTFIPSSFFDPVANTPVSMLALVLAAALSLCSQSDAFVAASLVQFGPPPSWPSQSSAQWSTPSSWCCTGAPSAGASSGAWSSR